MNSERKMGSGYRMTGEKYCGSLNEHSRERSFSLSNVDYIDKGTNRKELNIHCVMEKVGDNSKFIGEINETDTLKVRNIEISTVDRFLNTFRLTFNEFRIHIKIHGYCSSQVTEENEGIVREGDNTTKKRMTVIILE